MLTAQIKGDLAGNPSVPPKLSRSLDDVQFVDNASLRSEGAKAGLSKAQVDEAVQINADTRLAAVRLDFFALATLAALERAEEVHAAVELQRADGPARVDGHPAYRVDRHAMRTLVGSRGTIDLDRLANVLQPVETVVPELDPLELAGRRAG